MHYSEEDSAKRGPSGELAKAGPQATDPVNSDQPLAAKTQA